jgi:acetolactate synthase-1/2/3 large subunit
MIPPDRQLRPKGQASMDDGSTGQQTATVAEAFLAALSANGIRHVFANAGTDFAPIIEGLVRANDSGREAPRFVTVPHETVAMAMAQGYYKAGGAPAAVMVHVTVGTANATCGFINASRDNVPLLLAAGRTPLTESGAHGSRNVSIHWAQEAYDQGAGLREYAKWDYELRAGQPVATLVDRALDIAMTAPRGPVYMTLPREVLAGASPLAARGHRRPGTMPAAPSAEAMDSAAAAIARAKFPLIVYSAAHQDPASFAALSALARDHAIAVCDHIGGALPSGHEMNLGDLRGMPGDFVRMADVIVVFDAGVPWVPTAAEPAADATVIQIAPDPTFSRLPFRGFRSDLAIAGEPALAVALLHRALDAAGNGAARDARRRRIAEARAPVDEARAALREKARTMTPIHPAWTAHCLNRIKDDDAIVVNELGLPYEHLGSEQPGCCLSGNNASGLGRGLGEALGAKVAASHRQVIAAVGDGSYMFGAPTAAHYVGRAEGLPTLTIVSNNAEWFAVRRATTGMYPDGRAAKANTIPLVELSPSPSFEKTIEACDGFGQKVDDPAALPAALDRAFDAMAQGRSALLNVVTRAGGR